MNTAPIISKVWSFCITLRDDGVSYGDYLEQLTYLIFLIQDIDVELGKSNVLRQSILKKAFTGQLVGQDSNDEPASVLLEHIQADKVKQAAKKKARKRKATTSSTRQKRAPV